MEYLVIERSALFRNLGTIWLARANAQEAAVFVSNLVRAVIAGGKSEGNLAIFVRAIFLTPVVLAPWAAPDIRAENNIVIVHSFNAGDANDGNAPWGGPLLSGSTLYGTTTHGGSPNNGGTVYRVNTDGSGFSLLHSFLGQDGSLPFGALALSGSTLFGTTYSGSGDCFGGTVFRVNTDGTDFSVLHSFAGSGNGGSSPYGGLVVVGSTLYGTTRAGSNDSVNGNGTIFRLNTDGTAFATLHSFTGYPGDGAAPMYGALIASGSTLYGTTAAGGAASDGTVYQIDTDGTDYKVLHSFSGRNGDGGAPQGGLTLSGSTLYGMTHDGGTTRYGTVFQIDTDGTDYKVLHSFAGGITEGKYPFGGLTVAGSELYGTTSGGGSPGNGYGTVFQINTNGTDFNTLYAFKDTIDGRFPYSDLTFDGTRLYGVTELGDTPGSGVLGVLFAIPVPEPSTLALLPTAILFVFGYVLRRRRTVDWGENKSDSRKIWAGKG